MSKEFKRMQKLAGVNEIRVNKPEDKKTKIAKELVNISSDHLNFHDFKEYIRDYYSSPEEYKIDTNSKYYEAITYAYKNEYEAYKLYDNQFENINEIKINKPSENYDLIASKFKIPSYWTEEDPWQNKEDENERIIEFSAPMEGWDYNHKDRVWIEKTPEGKFIIDGYIPFGEFGDIRVCNTFKEAMGEIIEIMDQFKEDWDEYYEDEEDIDDES